MFDPYHKWLGIPKKYRPPTLYQVLGIEEDEDDPEVIDEAAIRQSAHIRTYQSGPQGDLCTKILNEISKARTVLLNPAKRKIYDAELAKRRPKNGGDVAPTVVEQANAVFADLDASPSLVNVQGSPSGRNLGGAKPKRRTGMALEKPAAGLNKNLLIFGIAGGVVVVLLAILIPVLLLSGGSPEDPPDKFVKKDRDIVDPVPPKPIPNPNPNPPNPNPPIPNPNPNPGGQFALKRIVVSPPNMQALAEVNRIQPNLPGNRIVNHLVLPNESEVILASPKVFAKYEIDTQKQVAVYRDAKSGPPHYNFFKLAPDGKTLYSVQMGEPVIRIWDLDTGTNVWNLHSPGQHISSFSLSPDGETALCCDTRSFLIWDTKKHKVLHRDDTRYNGFVFTPDSQKMYAMGRDKVDIWDVPARKVIQTINVPDNNFVYGAISPDGDVAVSYSRPNKRYGVMILRKDLADSGSFWTSDYVYSLAYSPDGKQLVIGYRGGFVHLISTANFRSLNRFRAHSGYIYKMQFSRDGKKLYTSGDEGFFKTWKLSKPADVAGNPSELPTPKLVFVGKRDATSNGVKVGITYELRVENWAEFKNDFFMPVEIVVNGQKRVERPLTLKLCDESGRPLVGYGGLSSTFLRRFVRTFSDSRPTPKGVYIVLEDRRNNKTIKSNVVMLAAKSPTPGTLPTPKLAFVGKRDQTSNGVKTATTYEFRFENSADFPDELFQKVEITGQDGSKKMDFRLGITTHNQTGRMLSGGVLPARRYIEKFGRTIGASQPQPETIYIVITDRLKQSSVKSNVVALTASSPTPPGTVPTPKLALIRASDATSNGVKSGTRYQLRIENWAEFSNDLFATVEIKIPTGGTRRTPPLRLQVYTDTGRPTTGYTLSSNRTLQNLSTTISLDQLQTNGLYVVIADGRDGKKYKSNVVTTPGGKYVAEGVIGRDPLPVFPDRYDKGQNIRTLALRPKHQFHLVAGTRVQMWIPAVGKFKAISEFVGGSQGWAALAVSPKGTIAATSLEAEADINIWDLVNTRKIIRALQGHSGPVRKVAFVDSGRKLLSASRDKTVRQWNVLTGQEIFRFPGYTEPVYTLAVSSGGKWFATFDAGGMLRKWDLENRENVNSRRLLSSTDGAVMDISPDDKIIAVANGRSLTLVDAETLTPVRRVIIRKGAERSVRFSPNGKLIVTCGYDNFTRVWDAANLEELFRIHHLDKCCDAVFAPDSQTVFVCIYNGIHIAKLYKSRDDYDAEVKTIISRKGSLSTTRKEELHTLRMEKGKTYMIDMDARFAADLILQSARGIPLASDVSYRADARIIFRAPQTADYRVIATSNSKRSVGPYDLQVQEISVSPAKTATGKKQPIAK